jgi:glyoxylase-like metal-dependent hydrolase (beta-lactamase superfamily II)
VRAVSVHPEALVLTSRMWQTTATALRADGEAMLLDAPYFPDELDALPGVLGGAGFEVDGLLSTHADFDHLLARLAFPNVPLGVGEATLLRLRARPGEAQRDLRRCDAEFYVDRERPLALGQVQAVPVPGKLELGSTELELHPAEGHTDDGMAVLAPELEVLCCGDYLSPVEIPLVQAGGSLPEYRATLKRLSGLLDRVSVVVPGHGRPLAQDDARRIAEEDAAYLGALEAGEERPKLPAGRDTPRQRKAHLENLRAVS